MKKIKSFKPRKEDLTEADHYHNRVEGCALSFAVVVPLVVYVAGFYSGLFIKVPILTDLVSLLPKIGYDYTFVARHYSEEEAEALADLYPALKPWRPEKPRIWEGEHRHLIYFEALSMALQVLEPEG